MHPGDGSTEEEAKELCHRMLVQGLLHPFSDGTAELHGDSTVSAGFNVRPLSLQSWTGFAEVFVPHTNFSLRQD